MNKRSKIWVKFELFLNKTGSKTVFLLKPVPKTKPVYETSLPALNENESKNN